MADAGNTSYCCYWYWGAGGGGGLTETPESSLKTFDEIGVGLNTLLENTLHTLHRGPSFMFEVYSHF
jgi:hypothetical protein